MFFDKTKTAFSVHKAENFTNRISPYIIVTFLYDYVNKDMNLCGKLENQVRRYAENIGYGNDKKFIYRQKYGMNLRGAWRKCQEKE